MADPRSLQEIHDVIAEEDAAWAAGDAVKFSSRVMPDTVFTNIFGVQFVGRDAFEKQHARIFATIYKDTHCRQTIAHARVIADDVAAVDTDVELFGSKFFPPGYKSDDGILRARLLQIMVRRPEGWRIASFHNVVYNPPPIPMEGAEPWRNS
jgi:uncharacterized protein (TIGR02246 family)